MKIGDSASLTHCFSAEEVARFTALTGVVAPPGVVPAPMLAALFSNLLGMSLPGPGTGWLKQELHYHGVLAIGTPVTAQVTVVRLRVEKRLADLMCQSRLPLGEILCEGRALMLLPSP